MDLPGGRFVLSTGASTSDTEQTFDAGAFDGLERGICKYAGNWVTSAVTMDDRTKLLMAAFIAGGRLWASAGTTAATRRVAAAARRNTFAI